MSLDFINKLNESVNDMDKLERAAGKDLTQPFSNTNSSSRKIMYASQLEQVLPLIKGEIPDISTGYENEFARYSSSLIIADKEYQVVASIPKYEHMPMHNYILILKSLSTNEYMHIHRVGYSHITESYGYLIDNKVVDTLSPGSIIPKGRTIQKSVAFDDFNNRQDGINLRMAYMSVNKTTEDSFIISDVAAKKMTSPLINPVNIIINDNDIPLNLYGNNELYKSIPDIGEYVQNGIICGIRRDRKEESLFTQSFNRLSDLMISDEKYIVDGRVVDINIYCNNPDTLDSSYYNSQLKFYYDQSMIFHRKIVDTLRPIVNDKSIRLSYDLKKLYFNSKRILEGGQYINDKVFSNIIMEVTVLKEDELSIGDKLTNRFGGKGVISEIRPQHLMPKLDNGEYIDLIANIFGCVNRENPGQLFVNSTTFMGGRFVESLRNAIYAPSESEYDDLLREYVDFVSHFSTDQSPYIQRFIDNHDDEDKAMLLDSIASEGFIKLVLEPISESMTINRLDEIYEDYDWIWRNPYKITVPIKGSTGEYRYVQARKSLYAGRQYIYRLKQYAKDKFSATSLSATNIRSEPTKSKANKNYKYPYTKTPIRFGEMETGDMGHLDFSTVVNNLMIHSISPIGRKQTKSLYTGDPFNVDVQLNDEAKNRNVEMLNVYLKTIGLKIIFKAIPKKLVTPFTIKPFIIADMSENLYRPFKIEGEEEEFVNTIGVEDKDGNYCPFNIVPFIIV